MATVRYSFWQRSRRTTQPNHLSTWFGTMRPTTAARQSKNGSHVRNAVSIWSSYQHIARTWTRLSVSGQSCMPMSRTTASIPLKSSSLTPYYTSSEKQFPKNGKISEVRSQTTFASSLTKTFGFWSEGGILAFHKSKKLIFSRDFWKSDFLSCFSKRYSI